MLAWIFRHRSRLQVVYGTVEPPPLAGARFARASALDQAGAGASAIPRDTLGPPRPGELRRKKKTLELRPMPRRVA